MAASAAGTITHDFWKTIHVLSTEHNHVNIEHNVREIFT